MSSGTEILILESGSDQLRLSLAQVSGQHVTILDTVSLVAQDKRDDRLALQEQILVDDLSVAISERQWIGKPVNCLLSGGSVSCQYFDMPALEGTALRQAVLLKLGQQLHFPVADAIVDIRTVPSATAGAHRQVRVVATAVHQDAARSAVNAAMRLGLELRNSTASASALTALAVERLAKPGVMQAVLHFGERNSTLVVLRDKTPCVTCELPVGLEDFTKALMRPIISGDDVIQLDVQQAIDLRNRVGIPGVDELIESLGITGAKLYPLIEPTMQKIVQQLTQWLTFAATTEGGVQVSELSLVGPGATMRGLADALTARLKLQTEASHWLKGRTSTDGAARGMAEELYAVPTAALLHQKSLPDLIPPDVRQAWKLRRIRRSTSLISPIVAAVILGFTFLFNQVQSYTKTSYGAQKALSEMQTLVDLNDRYVAEAQRVQQLESSLKSFSTATPQWGGLFKELSRLLPGELRVTKYTAGLQPDGLHLRVDANIYTTPTSRDLDEVIEQTLLSFERSPFFKKVGLINSTRFPQDGTRVETGVMAVDLHLAYEQPVKKAEGAP